MDKKSLLFIFLEKEKSVKPSFLLEERVMAQINRTSSVCVRSYRHSIWLQATAIAACAVITILIGINTGKKYTAAAPASISWNINDSQIENLAFYETGSIEK